MGILASKIALTGLVLGGTLMAQGPARPGNGMPARPAPVVSPTIESDGRVTFRISAPNANSVAVTGEVAGGVMKSAGADAAVQPAITMVKGDNGVWTGTTIRPMLPGAYRYIFRVDGVNTVDTSNHNLSPTQAQVQNVLYVPGDFSETRDVPHGAVLTVHYVATTLGNARREMYIYTPPGYEKGGGSYPVLYLIHGGGETAVSWSTVGRANDILDNLIAEKKAKPMLIVMPSGWTPKGGQVMTSDATKDPFNDEMMKDIIPYVEANFRVDKTPDKRAISGLSMGGIQTLNIGLHNLGEFRYVVVMSSGWTTDQDRQFFYDHEAANIPKYNSQLKLFWWGWGETDIARENSLKVTSQFKADGVKLETLETPGGHEWKNWRFYLYQVAPRLFQ